MLPSATEIVHALGLIDHLVGRSHECDYPPRVLELPEVTYAYIDSQASSRIIDLAVKKRAQQGLSLYGIHKDQIRKLEPDFIVTQTQCDLCAVSLRDVQTFLKDDVGVSAELLVLAPNALNDAFGGTYATPALPLAFPNAQNRSWTNLPPDYLPSKESLKPSLPFPLR